MKEAYEGDALMSREIPRKVLTLFEKTGPYGRCVLSPGHFVVEFAVPTNANRRAREKRISVLCTVN